MPNIDIMFETGKIASYKSYMHSNFTHKINMRQLFCKFGFHLDKILNAGFKQHNLMLSFLENVGLKRIKLICQLTFKQIRESDPDTIPLFGSKLDKTTPKNPKAIKTLQIKETEFSTRNPLLSSLAKITDFRQTFHINSAYFFQYGKHPKQNTLTKLDDELTMKSKQQIEIITGQQITQNAYITLCKNMHNQIQELKREKGNEPHCNNAIEILLHKPKNNNLILAIQQNNKSSARLARLSILKNYPGATKNTASKFNKESIKVTPEQLAKAALMSFKLPLGPVIRNFNFRTVTRQILSEKIIAKI